MCKIKGYVHIEDDKTKIKQSFLAFFLISGNTAAKLTRETLKQWIVVDENGKFGRVS